jgi:hypothetical protein
MSPEPAVAGVSDDREQPGTHVSTPEAAEMTDSSKKRVLNDVFRVVLVSQKMTRQGVRRIQMGKRCFLESCRRRCVHPGSGSGLIPL